MNPSQEDKIKSSKRDMANPQKPLNLDEYIPAKLTIVGRQLSQSASADFTRLLGVNIADWRILSTLNRQPDLSAVQISQITSFDKALISRRLKILNKEGYVTTKPLKQTKSKTQTSITKKGKRLYSDMVQIHHARKKILLSGLTKSEQVSFLRTLNKISENIQILSEKAGIDDSVIS